MITGRTGRKSIFEKGKGGGQKIKCKKIGHGKSPAKVEK